MTSGPVVVCLDKFRGSATAREACAWLAGGLRAADPELSVVEIPLADGGEGTVEALLTAGYSPVHADVLGPTGARVRAAFAVRGHRAVVELAQASGLDLVDDPDGAPLTATTYGTGQLIARALDLGCTEIVLAVGGSASTDGGAGLLQALGARITRSDGEEIAFGGAALSDATSLDLRDLDPRLREAGIVLASDVDNPLLGPEGAATVFAPQKGATPAQVQALEAALRRWAALISEATGTDHVAAAGAGAAGGAGFAALAVLGARRRNGTELVVSELGLAEALRGARLCVVGEGSFDAQSLRGKAPVAAAALAREAGVPVTLVAGRVSVAGAVLREHGIVSGHSLLEAAGSLQEAIDRAPGLLRAIGRTIADAPQTGT
ncbi:glycerate kinase [Spirillospora sp. CA-294931]|uniref:glycerate kinase n=1 Tax=Spirillospora sp. CA-294931 TaxID=3240042 RepID=UPI003D93C52E